MSIQPVTMYRVVCDDCGALADEGSDFCAWTDESSAEEVALAVDYTKTATGGHRCSDCTTKQLIQEDDE